MATKVAKILKIKIYHFTLSNKVSKEAVKWLKVRRKSGRYINKIKFRKPKIVVNIDKDIKLKALKIHSSQMDNKNAFTGFPKYAVDELLKKEYFFKF